MHPEGRHITRITCHSCGHAADVDPKVLRGLRGQRLFRALRCSKCGARRADVSIRWECPSRLVHQFIILLAENRLNKTSLPLPETL